MSDGADEPCRILEWDSAFFGRAIAAVNGDLLTDDRWREIEAFCKSRGVECLYFRGRADDAVTVRIAEKNSFQLVDVRIVFEKVELLKTPGVGLSMIRPAEAEDVSTLQQIARLSHTDSRFYYDPRFGRELCDKLYETWIAKAVAGASMCVLVAEFGGSPAGYVTCDRTKDAAEGSIGLIAVDAAHQGRGLGKLLVQAAIEQFRDAGMTRVSVVTQGRNLAAQRLYGRCGFIARDLQLYYHRWFTRGG